MDILFVGLALLLVWYVIKTALHHSKGSMYSDFAKEQARNKAHKEERLRMKAETEQKEPDKLENKQ